MKAAVLKSFGSPLAIEDVPAPVLGTGEVIVDIVATRVVSYTNEVLSGERKYALDLPVVPGAGGVGRVRAIGPDATKLAVGDWVLCGPTVRSRDDAIAPDIHLQGVSARGEGGMRLQKYFHHGSFAEQMRLPTENVTRLGADQRDGSRPMVRAGQHAGAVWRLPRRQTPAWRDRAGERRDRQFRQRRRGGGARDGRSLRRGARTQRDDAGRTRAPLRRASEAGEADGQRGRRSRAHEARRTWPDRLRVRHHAAFGRDDRGARRNHDGASLWPRRADGRRQHAGRRGPRPALQLDHARMHHHPRRLDVSGGCGRPPDRAGARWAAAPRSIRDEGLRSRPRQ